MAELFGNEGVRWPLILNDFLLKNWVANTKIADALDSSFPWKYEVIDNIVFIGQRASWSICLYEPVASDGRESYLVFCFADAGNAVQFKNAFDGISFYPEDRKGRSWKRPPGNIRQRAKPLNSYDW